jgi:tRNA(Ile)-lysidine synthase
VCARYLSWSPWPGKAPSIPIDQLLTACRFPPAKTAVTCAVSGGADSLALLVLACAGGLDVTAVHVDHGLRPGSASEADVVRAAATQFGAAFESERVIVEPGPNLEARARDARRRVLPDGALTGHTADDQAETVLLNLLRGSGVDGLAGMRAGPTKPILALRRAQTHGLCAELGLQPVQDPTNRDRRFRRNRVRHELLPLLNDIAQRDVVPVLARQAELIAADADVLNSLIALDPTDARALAAAPPALARRAVRQWLADPYPPDSAAVERILGVARNEAEACQVSGGIEVRRSDGRLRRHTP